MAKKPTKKDFCYNKIRRTYAVFPSARASQAIAKCRKERGEVRRTEEGSSLRAWAKEEWVQQYGQPCGTARKGDKTPYCRPSKRVSKDTPKTVGELSKSQLARKRSEKKKAGRGARVKPLTRRPKRYTTSAYWFFLRFLRRHSSSMSRRSNSLTKACSVAPFDQCA